MKKIILIIFLFCALTGKAQNLVLFVDTVLACPPNTVMVTVSEQHFDNQNMFVSRLYYNANSLFCIDSINLNPALAPGLLWVINNIEIDTGIIDFYWQSSGPFFITLPDNQPIITYLFEYLTDTSFLTGDVASLGGNPAVFIEGAVIPGGVAGITQQPIDITVVSGNMSVFYAATQTTGYIQYQWQISTDGGVNWNDLSNTPPYSGVNTNILTLDTVTFNQNNNLYRLYINACDAIYSQPGSLTVVSGIYFSGTLSYLNNSASPLSNATINLVQSGVTIYSVNPDNLGYFEFQNIQPGTYDINIQCFIPCGGNTAADALAVLKHFTGMAPLSGLPLQAADIDLSGFVNSMDALLILKRFVGLINHYPAGNWLFDAATVTIPAGGASLDIHGICVGDVNQSYIP
ncbi:MAG: dockerin type I repeat-containing protein [Bacteroidetes bacterium]|nr:dockerin type I repeat-containing protein [Bacteroidota bacterium]